ncbi:uncharacterized protein J7T54_000453 [Emericellopsis cladophorae]|uniref:Lipocalin/cytosolic fatty-acid binding domain-containing protein n=1 Tax=Emericellopsis cladophorae TaxID=2686198 RepID=A0A9P9XXP6_9HYPO|nr:uncharacterized protein J7T54_000453 [Emericellopsis cladophorae]KAI6779355.1 hypothetical protein J7T54_000453 [Emericellopsis cladophorae]
MRPSATALLQASTVSAAATTNQTQISNVVPSLWDGQCYYPTADPGFQLEPYLGRWYQTDGTVQVNNTCEAQGRAVNILGAASPADPAYGAQGVFRVQFPGQPAPDCAGPNYIVQDLADDIAIVQSNNFTTLFVLSREQHLEDAVLDAWIERAGILGSSLEEVVRTDQTDCQFI